jgi:hypothetical protein
MKVQGLTDVPRVFLSPSNASRSPAGGRRTRGRPESPDPPFSPLPFQQQKKKNTANLICSFTFSPQPISALCSNYRYMYLFYVEAGISIYSLFSWYHNRFPNRAVESAASFHNYQRKLLLQGHCNVWAFHVEIISNNVTPAVLIVERICLFGMSSPVDYHCFVTCYLDCNKKSTPH